MLKIIWLILKRKKYSAIALITALIFGLISYYLTVVNVYQKSLLVYADMNGQFYTAVSFFFGLVISGFFGLYLSLLIFHYQLIRSKKTVTSRLAALGGAAGGILASGCPSCGAPLLALMGFPLALFSLPFQGLEIKVLSLIFLALAIFLTLKNIIKNLTCSVKSPTV